MPRQHDSHPLSFRTKSCEEKNCFCTYSNTFLRFVQSQMKADLYLVVRPRQNPDQTFKNVWLNDDRLDSIETTLELGETCRISMKNGDRIYMHRCRFDNFPPCITCSALVVESLQIGQSLYLVRFAEHKLIGEAPKVSPPQGTNYYFATFAH